MPKKRGGQPGNQNARTHGFYSNLLGEKEKALEKKAARVSGLDQEINLLRAKIAGVVTSDPDNFLLILRACVSLSNMVRTQHRIKPGAGNDLKQASETIYKDLARPLGIERDNFFKLEP